MQQSFCEIQTSCCQCFGDPAGFAFQNAVAECVANLENVYAFSEECREANFWWESYALELEEETSGDDGDGISCKAFSDEGRYGPCSDQWLGKEMVECSL